MCSSGFTLVELMVVIAIIGLLSSIAIPQYDKFAAKARQSEAKIALSGIFTAEKSFAADQGSYTQCLAQAGFQPEPQGKRFYLVGAWNGTGASVCGPAGNFSCYSYTFIGANSCNCAGCIWSGNACGNDCGYFYSVSAFAPWLIPASFVSSVISQDAFRLGAIGNITNSPLLDVWFIDQGKVLTNTQSGI